jgi:hypothetical protein
MAIALLISICRMIVRAGNHGEINMSINMLLSLNDPSLAQLSKLLCKAPRPEIDNVLLAAVLRGNVSAVESALSSGANANVSTVFGFRPLHLAAVCYAERQVAFVPFQQFDQICGLLIGAGADILARDRGLPTENLYGGEGLTASARAASKGSAPPTLSAAMRAAAIAGQLDGRTGELDSRGNWRETDPVVNGKRVYPRRPYRFNGHGSKKGKLAAHA